MDKEQSILFKNIQTICKERDLPVSALEDEAGIPRGTIGNWSTERHWMIYLQATARTLGVSIDSLFLIDPALSNSSDRLGDKDRIRHLRILAAMDGLSLDDKSVNVIIEIAKLLQSNYIEIDA